MKQINIYFTDYFRVNPKDLENYGALNISLINDLPMFVDPFLIYESDDLKIKALHDSIIKYIVYLKDYAQSQRRSLGKLDLDKLESLFYFGEVKQNWLGFSKTGNGGAGLGKDFANKFVASLIGALKDFGDKSASNSSHLEKFTLIDDGVGRDKISDFTVNLIKRYLLEYTEEFAKKYIDPSFCETYKVSKVDFDYDKGRWKPASFYLPYYKDDFVILTPKEILTREETWINRKDMLNRAVDIAISTSNSRLRTEFSEMLLDELTRSKQISRPTLEDISTELISKFPEILDEYIALKEETGNEARSLNDQVVKSVEKQYISLVKTLVENLSKTGFYDIPSLENKMGANSFDEAMQRVNFLKGVIEDNDGYRIFYDGDNRIGREDDIQVMFRLTWLGTLFDVNRETNNGRGPADYSISKGSEDKTIVEFKLGSSTVASIKKNILNQLDIYKKAGKAQQGIFVILCFKSEEITNMEFLIKSLDQQNQNKVVIIDATPNKKSASKADEIKLADIPEDVKDLNISENKNSNDK